MILQQQKTITKYNQDSSKWEGNQKHILLCIKWNISSDISLEQYIYTNIYFFKLDT